MTISPSEVLLAGQVKLWRRYFSVEKSLEYFDQLKQISTLKQGYVKIYGKTYPTPRLESFHAYETVSYTYSGQQMQSAPLADLLAILLRETAVITEKQFNCALVNFYRDGNDSNGWHADDEKELGKNPIIASLSFGATRKFKLRNNATGTVIDLQLEDGDLLLMDDKMQVEWKHCIPKEPRILDSRINITFRNILPIQNKLSEGGKVNDNK